jgi:elongation factor Ts
MEISAAQIKQLREATGAGILNCRSALQASQGDFDKAVAVLREKGLGVAAKRADRETSNGVLDLYSHGEGRVGVMVEVNCETDFVARTAGFRTFAHEIALQIAAASPRWIVAEDVPAEIMEQERQEARQRAVDEGKPENIIERIVDGRLEKFLDENCLLRQTYIRDESKRVRELLQEIMVSTGEGVSIRRFKRWTVGEQIDAEAG